MKKIIKITSYEKINNIITICEIDKQKIYTLFQLISQKFTFYKNKKKANLHPIKIKELDIKVR